MSGSVHAALELAHGRIGLYDVDLYAPDLDPAKSAALRARVRRVYTRHRALCEDVHAIRILSPVRAVLAATITIDNAAVPELVLASVFYRIGNLLAPELRRQSLQELLDAGGTPASIFTGPVLRSGFVSDDQLEPRPHEFTLSQITQCLVATDGVAGVRHASLAIEGAAIEPGGRFALPVPDGCILRIDTRPVGDRFSVRVLREGVEYTPRADAVARELHRLWADHRRRFDVRADARQLLTMPRGQYIDAGSYVSIQEQYPAMYGINRFGVGSNATAARRASARQFKAYLLAFEQLLADSFAVVDGVRELCAIGREPRRRAFRQYPGRLRRDWSDAGSRCRAAAFRILSLKARRVRGRPGQAPRAPQPLPRLPAGQLRRVYRSSHPGACVAATRLEAGGTARSTFARSSDSCGSCLVLAAIAAGEATTSRGGQGANPQGSS